MTLTVSRSRCDTCGRKSNQAVCPGCSREVTCPTCGASFKLSGLIFDEAAFQTYLLTPAHWRAGMAQAWRPEQISVCGRCLLRPAVMRAVDERAAS